MKKEFIAGLGIIGAVVASEDSPTDRVLSSIPSALDESFVETLSGEELLAVGAVDVWLGDIEKTVALEDIIQAPKSLEIDGVSASELSHEELTSQAVRHRGITDDYNSLFGRYTSIGGDQYGDNSEYIDLIYKDARDHVLDGISLIHLLNPESSKKIKTDGEKIVFEDVELSLDDPLEFHVAAAIIYKELEKFDEHTDPEDYKNIELDIDDLKKLVGLNLNINIENNAFAIIPSDELVLLSRIAQWTELLGMPQPNAVSFVNHDKIEDKDRGGWYFRHNASDEKKFTISVSNRSGEDTIIHEWGHYFSDLWARDEKFSKFSIFKFENIYGKYDEEVAKFNRSRWPLLNNVAEEYAEAFVEYFTAGWFMRTKASPSYSLDLSEVVTDEYIFLRDNLFGGTEFDENGIKVKKLDLEESVYIGDVISIYNGELGRLPATYLVEEPDQPEPDYGDPRTTIELFDNARIEIIDGPVIVLNDEGEEVEMWKVKHVLTDGEKFKYGEIDSVVGWIKRSRFSEVIERPDQSEVENNKFNYSPELRRYLATGRRSPFVRSY